MLIAGAVKNFGGDLSDSIRSNASTRSKVVKIAKTLSEQSLSFIFQVVFDPRIFKTSAPAASPDPEKEYFRFDQVHLNMLECLIKHSTLRQMNKFHSSSTASRQGSIDKVVSSSSLSPSRVLLLPGTGCERFILALSYGISSPYIITQDWRELC